MQSLLSRRVSRWALALLVSAGSVGCTMDKTKAPALAGPSEFGLSIDLRATPDVLERDGSSQSVIRVFARDASGKLMSGQQFLLSLSPATGGTLSAGQATTGADGIATVYYTAVGSDVPISKVSVGVTPISGPNDSGNADNARTQIVTIGLRGASAAVSTFTFAPAAPKAFDLVTFDASGTTLDGKACAGLCTFAWTFGNEGTATGEVATHRFEAQGTHTVTLIVTGPGGVTVTTRKTVTVTEAPLPEAKFIFSPTNPQPGEEVRFSGVTSLGKGGARIVDYSWNFGNGETGSGETATTTFSAVRSYVVVLTVRDNNGQTSSISQTVSVTAAP